MNAKKIGFIMLAAALGAGASLPLLAAGAGEVVNLSGTLSAQRPDGALVILSQKSEVRPGDMLATQRDSYAQINFSDGSSMTMRPNTRMKIETYEFAEDKPQADSAFFRLIKGGLRTVTGLVGKRGNQDAYRIGTVTATIGVRGSTGTTLFCDPDCKDVVFGGETLQPGLHHETYTGSYVVEIPGQPLEEIKSGMSAFTDGTKIVLSAGSIPGVDLQTLPSFQTGAIRGFCR